MKVALITGITGQDGSYLAELLLGKGYEVHGIKRRSSLFNTDRIDHLYQDPHDPNQRLKLHYGDLTDALNLTKIIQESQPDEIYNLGAMSHVKVSFDSPEYVGNVDGLGTLNNFDSPIGYNNNNAPISKTNLQRITEILENLNLYLDIHIASDIKFRTFLPFASIDYEDITTLDFGFDEMTGDYGLLNAKEQSSSK